MLFEVCLDNLNEVVGKRKIYGWNIGIDNFDELFERPESIIRSRTNNAMICLDREWYEP
jgi:hypothetical protein